MFCCHDKFLIDAFAVNIYTIAASVSQQAIVLISCVKVPNLDPLLWWILVNLLQPFAVYFAEIRCFMQPGIF